VDLWAAEDHHSNCSRRCSHLRHGLGSGTAASKIRKHIYATVCAQMLNKGNFR